VYSDRSRIRGERGRDIFDRGRGTRPPQTIGQRTGEAQAIPLCMFQGPCIQRGRGMRVKDCLSWRSSGGPSPGAFACVCVCRPLLYDLNPVPGADVAPKDRQRILATLNTLKPFSPPLNARGLTFIGLYVATTGAPGVGVPPYGASRSTYRPSARKTLTQNGLPGAPVGCAGPPSFEKGGATKHTYVALSAATGHDHTDATYLHHGS
jgi:hypothetical protein